MIAPPDWRNDQRLCRSSCNRAPTSRPQGCRTAAQRTGARGSGGPDLARDVKAGPAGFAIGGDHHVAGVHDGRAVLVSPDAGRAHHDVIAEQARLDRHSHQRVSGRTGVEPFDDRFLGGFTERR